MKDNKPFTSKILTWLDQKPLRDRLDAESLKVFWIIGIICLVLSIISFLHDVVLRGIVFADGIDGWNLFFDFATVALAANIVLWSSKGIKEKS